MQKWNPSGTPTANRETQDYNNLLISLARREGFEPTTPKFVGGYYLNEIRAHSDSRRGLVGMEGR